MGTGGNNITVIPAYKMVVVHQVDREPTHEDDRFVCCQIGCYRRLSQADHVGSTVTGVFTLPCNAQLRSAASDPSWMTTPQADQPLTMTP
jgi:hypothetical protein